MLAGTALPFIYGDLKNLEQLFNENKGEVAAIMMEPLRSDIPEKGYLEGVQKLAKENNAILIFDEVSCLYFDAYYNIMCLRTSNEEYCFNNIRWG